MPYETLWIAAGERWSIDPADAASRIALAGRGGYCYHLNGALGLLRRAGRDGDARDAYQRALDLAQTEPERRFLQSRIIDLGTGYP